MKTKLVLLAIALVVVNLVSAQEVKKAVKVGNWQLSDVTVTSGKGALTSGFDTQFGFTNLKNDKLVLFLQANNDRICATVGKRFGNFKVLESFAVFKNIPWTGPMILYSAGPFDAIVWNGVGFAKTNELLAPSYKPQFFFSYEGVGLTFLKNNRIGASAMWFGTTPVNWFVSYKHNFNIGEKSKLFAECTYNHNLDIPMFVIGYSLKLK